MRHIFTPSRLAAATAALCLLNAAPGQAQTVYGLSSILGTTTSNLVTFQATAPGTFTAAVPITGITAGQIVVGIDSRPNTGELFALGYNTAGTLAQLYTIAPATGAATAVGAPLVMNLGTTTIRIGFDFNPTVDRIRVTAGNGADFRINPNNGALAATDGTLAYATTDPNAAQTPIVGSSAYTNSYIGTTATTLYDLDEGNSRLVIQNPPNNGTLVTVGPLGVTTNGASQVSDLDIYFNPTTSSNVAYMSSAVLNGTTSATSTLYTVNLSTGAATAVGMLGSGTTMVVHDITFAITRTVPTTVTGNLAYALAGTNLISFDTALPGTIRTSVGISGMLATETLVGLDIRPTTNTLYALGYNATAQTYTLYALNSMTGVAVPVNAAPIALALGTGKISFDFNPTVDRIRVMSSNRANFRINPIDGTVAATDGTLTYATGDANAAATPNIGAAAYTNSVAGTTATTTTLYDYDLSLNILTMQNPPNNGTLNTVGATGITANAAAPSLDMDIYSSAAGTNTAYLVANTGTAANTSLYTLNLTTGAATMVGTIGNGLAARDITVAGAAGVVATAVRERTELATNFSLYPNPATRSSQLAFTLARAGQVEVGVFDMMGRRVAAQPLGLLPVGAHTAPWAGSNVRAGLYLVRLTVDGLPAATRQIVVE